MTAREHRARCEALRGGVTESEQAILADLEACENRPDDWASEKWRDRAERAEGTGLREAAQHALECLDRFDYFRDSGVKLVADALRSALRAQPPKEIRDDA